MHKDFIPPISIEEFAAYLDGNLSEEEMNRIDALVSVNPNMEELVAISDAVDENIQAYMQDEFTYEADMIALENSDYDIPNLDVDIVSQMREENSEYKGVTNVIDAADEIVEIDKNVPLNSGEETLEAMIENSTSLSHQDEDSVRTYDEYCKCDSHDSSDFPCVDDFFES